MAGMAAADGQGKAQKGCWGYTLDLGKLLKIETGVVN